MYARTLAPKLKSKHSKPHGLVLFYLSLKLKYNYLKKNFKKLKTKIWSLNLNEFIQTREFAYLYTEECAIISLLLFLAFFQII